MKTPTGGNQSGAFFCSLTELARDKGWIGQILSLLPHGLLRDADDQAQSVAKYRREVVDPQRLPLPNPWPFLLKVQVPEHIEDVCRAAQSQLGALHKLCRMATTVASLNTDWQEAA